MKPENPPAFPMNHETYSYCQGMSLRDYFAALVMQALTNTGDGPSFGTVEKPFDPWPWQAEEAYKAADAMLAAREREEVGK